MNTGFLIGRIGQDLELRRTQNGKAVCTFSVAVGSGDKTDWFRIVAWEKTAEFVCKWFGKGRRIAVVYHPTTRVWEDKNGNKRVDVEFIADSVDFADAKSDNSTAEQRELTAQLEDVPEEDGLPF